MFNDKHSSISGWFDAMGWLELEWLPQAQALGLRAFAYVFAPDLNNQLAFLGFVTRSGQALAIQVFYDSAVARAWLRWQLL